MKKMRLERTFWPVGHGAFYTEKLRASDLRGVAVYDCGGDKKKELEGYVDEFVESLHRNPIDYLFISHFHEDHIKGVQYLIQKAYYVKKIIVPRLEGSRLVEAYVYNALKGCDKTSDTQLFVQSLLNPRIGDSEVVQITSNNKQPKVPDQVNINRGYSLKPSGTPFYLKDEAGKDVWAYMPVNIDYDKAKRQTLITALNKICRTCKVPNVITTKGDINWSSIDTIVSKKLSLVKKAYAAVFGENHNAYSMPVYSGPCANALYSHMYHQVYLSYPFYWHEDGARWRCFQHDKRMLSCLYMGDFEAKEIANVDALEEQLGKYYGRVGLIQVPHHFSPRNHSDKLYKYRTMAFGNVADYGDECFSQSTCQSIEYMTKERPIIVTENNNTRCEISCDMY